MVVSTSLMVNSLHQVPPSGETILLCVVVPLQPVDKALTQTSLCVTSVFFPETFEGGRPRVRQRSCHFAQSEHTEVNTWK